MRTINKLWVWVLGAVIIFGGVYSLFKLSPQLLGLFGFRQVVGEQAPDFTLTDLAGKEIKFSDFAGRVRVVNFWTSWNEASLEQLKILDDYYKNFEKDNLVIFAVNSMETGAAARKIVAERGLGLGVLFDSEGMAGEAYSIGVLPLTVFVDRAGFVSKRAVGILTLEEVAGEISRLRR